MKKPAALLTLALLSVGLATSALAQTNLVVNGSFEAGPAGENVFTDWGWVAGSDGNSNFGVTNSTTPPAVAENNKFGWKLLF